MISSSWGVSVMCFGLMDESVIVLSNSYVKRKTRMTPLRSTRDQTLGPSHPHLLDACDQMGLLVLEEISGWQHIGNESWKLISIDNVARMIRRDWNHPSIIFFLILPGSLARKLEGIAWWRSQSP